MIELMRFGLEIKMFYSYDNNEVELKHGGYIWRLLGFEIPIPFTVILGRVYAEEEVISVNSFRMLAKITHPLSCVIFSYDGVFELN